MFQKRQEFLEWLRSIEKKWQSIWSENRVFQPEVVETKPKYFITVPYPYANGPLHIGHGRTYTIGDVIARYKRLRGFNVLFPMAFHITGTPIVAFSEMISRGDIRTISLYRDYIKLYLGKDEDVDEILNSFKDPLNLATFFADRIQRDFEELGYSIDWRRKFHTGEPIYNRFVTWQFYRLLEKGLITRGDYIVTYCLLHAQPEGEDDIQDADVNPVEVVEYVAIKFKLVDANNVGMYLLAGTLRPETLFGVTNIWVNPEADYILYEYKGEKYVLSSKALIKFIHQHPDEEIRVISHIKGKDLLGKWVESPLGTKVAILPAWFVDPENATGIVYSEPSDAPYDYIALIELKKNPELLSSYGINPDIVFRIEPKKIISMPGIEDHHAKVAIEKFNVTSQRDPRLEEISSEVYREQFYNGVMVVEDPAFNGLSVRDAREKLRATLYSNGKALPFYELNRRAWCRAGGEIVVAKIKGQWFINYNLSWLKERARKALEAGEIHVVPAKYKKLFVDTLDWLDKRPCARKRGIGTKLPWSPDWIIESLSDSTIYMAFYTIAHIIRENNISEDSLIPDVFDYVFLGRGDPSEVSRKSRIPVEILEKMRKEFTYWYPVDHRHTAIPHITNHLTFYILHHLAIFPEKLLPRLITLNEAVIREGAKMSKSKGNVIPLRHIVTQYSADLFRLYISWAANLDSILDWRETEVNKTVDSLIKFANVARASASAICSEQKDTIFTSWFINKFYEALLKATTAIESFEIRDYAQIAFFDILSLVDRYRGMVGDQYVCGLKRVLADWIIILSPLIPHLAEEINSWLGGEKLVSLASWPEGRVIDEEVVTLVDSLESLISDARELLGLVRKRPARMYIIVAPEWKKEIAKYVISEVPLKSVIDIMRAEFGLRGREAEIVDTYNAFKKLDKSTLSKVIQIRSKNEFNVYKEALNYIKSRLAEVDEVVVLWEDEARSLNIPKAERALPLRPALYIE